MLRAPFALEKMSYDPDSGMVLYRSRLHKTLKRNFQVMPGAEILSHLGKFRCNPQDPQPPRPVGAPPQGLRTQHGPPARHRSCAPLNVLTYHSVPDIA